MFTHLMDSCSKRRRTATDARSVEQAAEAGLGIGSQMTVTHTGESHLDFGYQIRGELEQSLVTAAHSDWHGQQMRHRRTGGGGGGADRGICFFCLFGVMYLRGKEGAEKELMPSVFSRFHSYSNLFRVFFLE